jgi:3-deoxy-D-manno-octulosonic-acid transferase
MYLLSPLWLVVTAVQTKRRGGGWRFLSTRMGWRTGSGVTDQARQTTVPQLLWFHAASVGEVKAILPLLQHIEKRDSNLRLHVTCTTPESLLLLQRATVSTLSHDYAPIDFYGSIHRLYQQLNPLALIIVETEIWPNLYRRAGHFNLPLVIINGRLSTKTRQAPAIVLKTYRQVLQHVTLVLSRSEADTDSFQNLGVDAQRVRTIGNIKTYTGAQQSPVDIPELAGRSYILAASTHEPEEQQLCEAFATTDFLLVIAPRHVQRSLRIQQMLTDHNTEFAVRSRNDSLTPATNVYLADTTGEIDALIKNANMVFVGGSLIERGGHNVLEPAIQGVPVFTGPHTKNFKAEVELLQSFGAITIVNSATELADRCTALNADHEELQKLGAAGKQAIASTQHIFDQYSRIIDQLIAQWREPSV